jgi:selenocysteine-specific elongation factor
MADSAVAAADAPLTLGTAGHIDHGKTALIAALTGVDTDRLPEERERGISIELGYARLELPSGRSLSVVDVPGHERFVRTMVAGATGVDMFLMTVAADDGVMPQTREHAAVLAGLGVRYGVVAITKCDLMDPDPAAEEAADLLPGAPLVAVSARTGAGLDDLRAALDATAAEVPSRARVDGEPGDVRLHVDRAFTIHGAGTVVTGTLWSGTVRRGDELAVLPSSDGRGSGRLRGRVRAVQVHDRTVERADAGQRVALNLAGLDLREVGRGDVVVSRASELGPTYLIDAELDAGDARSRLVRGGRVQVHHGTRESPARVAPLGGRFFQLRLERPLAAAAGDRLVVRQIAPPDTLGGGGVLDPHPRKHGASREVLTRLERLARGELAEPERPEALQPRRAPAEPDEPPPLSTAALALERRLREAGHEPPLDSELGEAAAELPALRAAGGAVRVGRQLHFHPETLAEVQRRVTDVIERDGSITVARLRDELGTSRKFAQALLEHFDGEKVTRRVGDAHVLRRR